MRLLTTFAAFIALGASALAMPPVPRPAKEFDFVEPSGQHILLSSLKGKVVLVQGLLTTCSHCQAMSQMLTKIQNDYGPRGFQALGVAGISDDDNNAGRAQNYVTQFHLNFPVSYTARDTIVSFWGHSVIERLAVPQVMIIDRKGIIQAESAAEGTPELQQETGVRAWIEKLLGPAPGISKGAAPPATSTKKPADTTKKPTS
jgi:peroxiredoxin